MDFEKSCYSLVGCVIAGSVVQKNMSLPVGSFVVITLVLWGCCLGIQYYSSKKQQVIKKTYEDNQKILYIEGIDKIVHAFADMLESQKNDLSERQDSNRDFWLKQLNAAQKEYAENNREITERLNNIMSGINDYKEMADEAIHNISNQIEVILVKNIKNGFDLINYSINAKSDLHNEIIHSNCTSICNEMISSRESQEEKITALSEIIQTGKREWIDEMKDHTERFYSTICEKMDKYDELIQANAAELCRGISQVEDEQGKMTDSVHSINEILILFKECVDNSNVEINNTISEMNNNLSKIQNIKIDAIMEELKHIIKEFKDTVEGMISNMQATHDTILNNVDEIKDFDKDLHDYVGNMHLLVDEMKLSYSDEKNDLFTKIDEIKECVDGNVEKQSVIIEQYDKVLCRINDDVIVNIINDSNNLLKCMKDCYILMDSIRKRVK